MEKEQDRKIDKLVDTLILADRIGERYREKKQELGEEADFEPLGLMERVGLVQCLHTMTFEDMISGAKGQMGLQAQLGEAMKLVQTKLSPFKTALTEIAESGSDDAGELKEIARKALSR